MLKKRKMCRPISIIPLSIVIEVELGDDVRLEFHNPKLVHRIIRNAFNLLSVLELDLSNIAITTSKMSSRDTLSLSLLLLFTLTNF